MALNTKAAFISYIFPKIEVYHILKVCLLGRF